MLTIHLITLGKLKEPYWQDAEREYVKRLTPYAKVIIHEAREESFGDRDAIDGIKKKEAEKIKSILLKIRDAFIFVLDETGEKYSSVKFAEEIKNLLQNNSTFVFIIGGPLGLDVEIKKAGSKLLSLSDLTFTHQMARVFLLEQLYRSFMILSNRRYHY